MVDGRSVRILAIIVGTRFIASGLGMDSIVGTRFIASGLGMDSIVGTRFIASDIGRGCKPGRRSRRISSGRIIGGRDEARPYTIEYGFRDRDFGYFYWCNLFLYLLECL